MEDPNDGPRGYLWRQSFFKKKKKNNLQAKVGFEKTKTDFVAKYLTEYFGSIWFLFAFLTFVVVWFLLLRTWPYDPLAFCIQIFEVCLSIIVLVSQNRESDIDDIRQQIDLEINVRAEKEITKILHMIQEIHKEMGINKKDLELEEMKEGTNLSEIKAEVEQVIENEKKMPVQE